MAVITAPPNFTSILGLLLISFPDEFAQLASTNTVNWLFYPGFKLHFVFLVPFRYRSALFADTMSDAVVLCGKEASILLITNSSGLVCVAIYIKVLIILLDITCSSSSSGSYAVPLANIALSIGLLLVQRNPIQLLSLVC